MTTLEVLKSLSSEKRRYFGLRISVSQWVKVDWRLTAVLEFQYRE